ncbi:type IV toxin-antitoxin system AbiEi family antitoxin domain-containing protein [Pseudoclavibacter terrae]|uniref:type IV toxin-antitoxin system AbiEi family antitoxin domain-containing protein n=1 Tax=Pseudoclavibacter terrae TaxID=1530195 RepID=UPI00232C6947|nr:type IV toxin-antitoxin system AbiEi family antitoxin domain-containing protein [Pseudoclavibacter terrae]
MSSISAVGALADVSAAQWGLLTTAQANDVGVSRVQLTRLARQGLIERLTQGVYRDAHIPENELDGLRAAWLSTEPGLLAEQRLANPSAIVSGRTTAYVHPVSVSLGREAC